MSHLPSPIPRTRLINILDLEALETPNALLRETEPYLIRRDHWHRLPVAARATGDPGAHCDTDSEDAEVIWTSTVVKSACIQPNRSTANLSLTARAEHWNHAFNKWNEDGLVCFFLSSNAWRNGLRFACLATFMSTRSQYHEPRPLYEEMAPRILVLTFVP